MSTILHSIDTGGPGGAETVFTTLAASPAPGDRHVALAKPGGWVEETLTRLGVESHFAKTQGSFNRDYLGKIVSLIRAHDVDLIQSHLYGSNLYCAIAGRLTGVPVVAAFHGAHDLSAPGLANGVKRRMVAGGAHALVAVSNTLRQELIAAGFRDSPKLGVVHNGVDIERFASASAGRFRAAHGIPADAPLIGALGNIRRPKAYPLLVAAMANVRDTVPEAHLVIAGQGDGALLDELHHAIEHHQLGDAVHLPGFLSDTPAMLADLDVYCSSSLTEGFSLTCVEAMAAGIPVVATRSGGPEEILSHEETGLLVPVGDAEALADALISTLTDTDSAARRIARARERAQNAFSTRAMVAGYQAIYRRLTGTERSP